jgi:hypothetical protein
MAFPVAFRLLADILARLGTCLALHFAASFGTLCGTERTVAAIGATFLGAYHCTVRRCAFHVAIRDVVTAAASLALGRLANWFAALLTLRSSAFPLAHWCALLMLWVPHCCWLCHCGVARWWCRGSCIEYGLAGVNRWLSLSTRCVWCFHLHLSHNHWSGCCRWLRKVCCHGATCFGTFRSAVWPALVLSTHTIFSSLSLFPSLHLRFYLKQARLI